MVVKTNESADLIYLLYPEIDKFFDDHGFSIDSESLLSDGSEASFNEILDGLDEISKDIRNKARKELNKVEHMKSRLNKIKPDILKEK